MATSPQELLDQTNAAISACLSAQSYSVAGREKQMAQLAQLSAFRMALMNEIQAGSDSSGGMCSLGIQVRPSR